MFSQNELCGLLESCGDICTASRRFSSPPFDDGTSGENIDNGAVDDESPPFRTDDADAPPPLSLVRDTDENCGDEIAAAVCCSWWLLARTFDVAEARDGGIGGTVLTKKESRA